MKKISLSLLSLVACMMLTLSANARGINFAITLADDAGNLQSSSPVSLRLSLVPEQDNAQACYIETHQTTTNEYGVANVVLGEGSPVAGQWDDVDWSVNTMYLKVESADSPVAEYSPVSTLKLGAVPYAYFAQQAERLVLTSPDGQKWEVKADEAGNVYSEPSDGNRPTGPEYGTVDYIFDMDALPSITLEFSTDEWNQFLANFDANSQNEECVHADFYFNKRGRIHHLTDVGVRLRGNTSRIRPEGVAGQQHTPGGDFHHVHFGFRFQKFHKKDPEHLLSGTDRFNLRWAHEDPTYCHEIYGYDLMRRFGVWSTARSSYCRVFIKFKEEQTPVYYGVYEMFECYDDQYLADQVEAGKFAGDGGYLWKGGWGSGVPANFSPVAEWAFGIENVTLDPSETRSYTYDFKGKEKKLLEATAQLQDFITKVNTLEGDAFKTWAEAAIDTDLLLRAMACEVAVGHWDDFWANGNNYYIYFDNEGTGKMYYLPYDLDNTLGTCSNILDAGRKNPLEWGSSPLANKMLSIPEYKSKFIQYLNELADADNDFIDPVKSAERIKKWHEMIQNYVDNDTHEDTRISDRPASWSTIQDYRVLDVNSENNFFKAKIKSIKEITK